MLPVNTLELSKEDKLNIVSLSEKDKEKLLDTLRQSKIKITDERREIIGVLQKAKIPLSPADIFHQVNTNLPKANLTTIYRNLEMLEVIGLVKRLAFNKTNFSYELISGRNHHHHLVCIRCSSVEDLENISEKFVRDISKKTEFKVKSHNLEFFGLCQNCKK